MYIKRNIEDQINARLIDYQMPILVQGSRQVGKTTTIKKVLEEYDYIHINLFEQRQMGEIFNETNDLDINTLIGELEDYFNREIKEDTIIFIDEIQVNYIAFACLKTFNEAKRNKVIVSGSNVTPSLFAGSNVAYPVGQFIRLDMHPISFSEFLRANDNQFLLSRLIDGLQKRNISLSSHKNGLEQFDLYLQLGGMPNVVVSYLQGRDYNEVQTNLYDNYVNDFAKYAEEKDIKYLKAIYENIPANLGKQNQRFVLSQLGYNNQLLADAIEWLSLSRMAIFSYKVKSIRNPLSVVVKPSFFKLFINDTGLLVNKQSYNVAKHARQVDDIYLGEICENYIATVLIKYMDQLTYYEDNYEIDFVFYRKNKLIALEIKAGNNTKAKSLTAFTNKFAPDYSIKLSRNELAFNKFTNIPLYALDLILENEINGYLD